MSTRGNICIKVKEKDFEFVEDTIDEKISESSPYLFIYNHFDSYPEGLGENLIKNYNDYEAALDLVLDGDCSTPGVPYAVREGYSHTKPRVVSNIAQANQEEYLYVFDEGWKCYDDSLELKEIPNDL